MASYNSNPLFWVNDVIISSLVTYMTWPKQKYLHKITKIALWQEETQNIENPNRYLLLAGIELACQEYQLKRVNI